ncbi:MAG: homocysteine S-methyltransferase family protein [Pseudomonadota bacterium]
MSRYDDLMTRIARGERVLIDGGTGTEVDRRGVPQLENAWNGGGTLSHPDIVCGIHHDYISQGAEIVISNTFAATRHALQDAGEAALFDDYNRRGIELAIEAHRASGRDSVLVSGGISYWSWTGRHPGLESLGQDVTRQAQVMADAGADLLMLEMMVGIDRMLVTLQAAQACGLPVWVGLSCRPNDQGQMALYDGDLLFDALAALDRRGVPLISIMHTQVAYVDACLDIVDQAWAGPVGVYAHTGTEIDTKWTFHDTITPRDYADNARRWLDRGVQVIGGCCGIRPEHIATMAPLVEAEA